MLKVKVDEGGRWLGHSSCEQPFATRFHSLNFSPSRSIESLERSHAQSKPACMVPCSGLERSTEPQIVLRQTCFLSKLVWVSVCSAPRREESPWRCWIFGHVNLAVLPLETLCASFALDSTGAHVRWLHQSSKWVFAIPVSLQLSRGMPLRFVKRDTRVASER